MSILLNITKNFNVNRLPALRNWTAVDATATQNGISLAASTGKISTSLSFNGLNSSSYRLLRIVFRGTLPEASNFGNRYSLEFIMKYRYLRNVAIDDDTERSVYQYMWQSVVISPLNTTQDGDDYICEKILACPEIDATSIEIVVRNRTNAAIEIRSCTLKQSYDTQPAQLTEQIDWAVGLEKVDAYTDGCLIYYRGDSEPLQLQYQEDNNGNFCGILVNDSLLIPFTRNNEPL